MRTFNAELVRLFNVSIVDPKAEVDYVTLNRNAMQVGYIIHPQAANNATKAFIQGISGNINSTFYKTWDDITSKTRFELFVDQLMHYVTTYGTDFACEGNGYVPNDTPVGPVTISMLRDFKVIMPATEEEVYEKCMNMLGSGIALKSTTAANVCNYVCEYVETYDVDFNIDDVMNKEAVVYICDKLGIAPNRKFDLLRFIMLKTTGDAMLIKSADKIQAIKHSGNQFDFTMLNDYQLRGLASIFYRFKPLFLAFKKTVSSGSYWRGYTYKTSRNASVINKLRRMANKYHEPLPVSVESTLLSTVYTNDILLETAHKMNNFQLIRILNTIAERMNRTDEKITYIIRNGKQFVTDSKSYDGMFKYYMVVYNVLYTELITRLAEKQCYVKYQKYVDIACPTSEKNFVGDLPFGTNLDMSENNSFFGIYWRNEWGTRDFDLSVLDNEGRKIGWNSSYYSSDQDIVYSGDMTNANPEATEIMLFKKGCSDGSVMINRYSGNDGSKFRIFAGTEDIVKLTKNYMVNPSNIKLQADCESTMTQQMLGLLAEGKFYVMTLGNGNSIVSYARGTNPIQRFDATVLKVKSYLKLKPLLTMAGFVDVDTVEELPEDAKVLDLTQLSRDTLIELFS